MAAAASPQLETGSLPTTPVEDNLLRQFVHSQAVVNSITAAAGGRTDRSDDVFLADTGGPIPYLIQAILTRPLDECGTTQYWGPSRGSSMMRSRPVDR
jgi:hypothetical protein